MDFNSAGFQVGNWYHERINRRNEFREQYSSSSGINVSIRSNFSSIRRFENCWTMVWEIESAEAQSSVRNSLELFWFISYFLLRYDWLRPFEINRNESSSASDFLELLDSGLLAIADSDYKAGCEYFQRASSKDPANIMV